MMELFDDLRGAARLELTGGERLLIEEHKGVLEYTTARLRVALPRGTLVVTGEGLELTALTLRELAVRGNIRCIELEGESGC